MNQFANQATLPPTEDKMFAGDQLIDPREVVGDAVYTQLWRKDKKTGQMRKIQFAPYQYMEFPKTMYPPAAGDLQCVTVYDPDEEKRAEEMGYVDHPDKAVQMKGTIKNDDGEFEVSAVSGSAKPVEGKFSTAGRRLGRPPGRPAKAKQDAPDSNPTA